VQSSREIVDTPGCIVALYIPISRNRINIEETVSCFTETIIVLKMEDAGRAFNLLTDLISNARKMMARRSRS
ncbi:MAG: ACT domain-containing protein, partial [Candidatus Bathyarchaeota archaeon]|nr:ACT domain-containing protein [Candidatus Bathyarchaeota archaeon]